MQTKLKAKSIDKTLISVLTLSIHEEFFND